MGPLSEFLQLGRSHQALLEPEEPQLLLDFADAPPGSSDALHEPLPISRRVSALRRGPSSQNFQSQGGGAAASRQEPLLPAAPDIIFLALPVGMVQGGPEGLHTDVGMAPNLAGPSGSPLPFPQLAHCRGMKGEEGNGERPPPFWPRVRSFTNAVARHWIMYPLQLLGWPPFPSGAAQALAQPSGGW